MKKTRTFARPFLAAGLLAVLAACGDPPAAEAPKALSPEQTIIPKPLSVEPQPGEFAFGRNLRPPLDRPLSSPRG